MSSEVCSLGKLTLSSKIKKEKDFLKTNPRKYLNKKKIKCKLNYFEGLLTHKDDLL